MNDLIEELCGARLTYNYHRIGGVSWDMPKGWADKVKAWLYLFEPMMDEFDRLITPSTTFLVQAASPTWPSSPRPRRADWALVWS